MVLAVYGKTADLHSGIITSVFAMWEQGLDSPPGGFVTVWDRDLIVRYGEVCNDIIVSFIDICH